MLEVEPKEFIEKLTDGSEIHKKCILRCISCNQKMNLYSTDVLSGAGLYEEAIKTHPKRKDLKDLLEKAGPLKRDEFPFLFQCGSCKNAMVLFMQTLDVKKNKDRLRVKKLFLVV